MYQYFEFPEQVSDFAPMFRNSGTSCGSLHPITKNG